MKNKSFGQTSGLALIRPTIQQCLKTVLCCAALGAVTMSVQAQNLLVNSGFETQTYASGDPLGTSTANGGWFGINGTGSGTSQGFSSVAALSGTSSYLVTMGAGDAWDFTGPYQLVSGITAGVSYNDSFSFMSPTAIGNAVAGNLGNSAVGVTMQLQYYNSSFATVGSIFQTVNTGVGLTPGSWNTLSINNALAPTGATYAAVYYAFMLDGTQTAPQSVYFDNASLSAVPEPGTVALAGLGGFALFGLIRRRK